MGNYTKFKLWNMKGKYGKLKHEYEDSINMRFEKKTTVRGSILDLTTSGHVLVGEGCCDYVNEHSA
jgi:hypothetical protein